VSGMRSPRLNDEAMRQIFAVGCKQLTLLRLNGCSQFGRPLLGDGTARAVAEAQRHNLIELSLIECDVSSDSIQILVRL